MRCVDGRSSSRDLATAAGIACFGGEAACVFFICAARTTVKVSAVGC